MKTGGPCRFVLEAIDDKTESIATDVSFDANDVELCRMIGATATEFGSSAVYELQAGAVVQLKARFKIALDATTAIVRLRRWQPQDDLPYKFTPDES
jgi:hypothetical protein